MGTRSPDEGFNLITTAVGSDGAVNPFVVKGNGALDLIGHLDTDSSDLETKGKLSIDSCGEDTGAAERCSFGGGLDVVGSVSVACADTILPTCGEFIVDGTTLNVPD